MATAPENDINPAEKKEAEEELFSSLFPDLKPPSDEEVRNHSRVLREKGFQIAFRNVAEPYEELIREISGMKEDSEKSGKENMALFGNLVIAFDKRIKIIDGEIAELKARLGEKDKDLAECTDRRVKICDDIEKLKQELIQLRGKLAVSKKGIGEKLVTDVEAELSRVLDLQKKIHGSLKATSEEKYAVLKDAMAKRIIKWQQNREKLVEHFELLHAKTKTLGGEGINPAAAYLLMALGSAMAGVAGYFYSIFSAKSGLSTNDVFNYLFKNVLEAIQGSRHEMTVKFLCLIGILAVITLVGWATDHVIRKRTLGLEDDEKGYESLGLDSKMDFEGGSYTYNMRDKSWFMFWLRSLPLFLIAGIVVLILSKGVGVGGKIDELSASTEGILVGSAMAMGLAGILYLYITKVIESRQSSSRPGSNWEIIATIALFIFVSCLLVFYHYSNRHMRMPAVPFSVAGFLASCFVTAFSFAYGARFMGLLDTMSAVENRIHILDSVIALKSYPEQPGLWLDYKKSLNKLVEALQSLLERKGKLLGRIGNKNDDTITPLKDGRGNVKALLRFPGTKPPVSDFADSQLFEFQQWELEYFPEYAEELRILGSIYNDKKVELKETDTRITQIKTDKEKQSGEIKDKVEALQRKKERIDAVRLKANRKLIDRREERRSALENDIVLIKDGYDLGLWYKIRQN